MVASTLLLSLMLSIPFSAAQTLLEGGVKKVWTIPEAREEVFKGAQGVIDTWGFPTVDPNRQENFKAIALKKGIVANRQITVFNDKSYGVTEECSLETRYYDPVGALTMIQLDSTPGFSNDYCEMPFPSKALRYDYPSGRLIQAAFSTSEKNDYVYEADGSFLGHWLGAKCYNEDGSTCGWRRSFIEKSISRSK